MVLMVVIYLPFVVGAVMLPVGACGRKEFEGRRRGKIEVAKEAAAGSKCSLEWATLVALYPRLFENIPLWRNSVPPLRCDRRSTNVRRNAGRTVARNFVVTRASPRGVASISVCVSTVGPGAAITAAGFKDDARPLASPRKTPIFGLTRGATCPGRSGQKSLDSRGRKN